MNSKVIILLTYILSCNILDASHSFNFDLDDETLLNIAKNLRGHDDLLALSLVSTWFHDLLQDKEIAWNQKDFMLIGDTYYDIQAETYRAVINGLQHKIMKQISDCVVEVELNLSDPHQALSFFATLAVILEQTFINNSFISIINGYEQTIKKISFIFYRISNYTWSGPAINKAKNMLNDINIGEIYSKQNILDMAYYLVPMENDRLRNFEVRVKITEILKLQHILSKLLPYYPEIYYATLEASRSSRYPYGMPYMQGLKTFLFWLFISTPDSPLVSGTKEIYAPIFNH